MSTTKGWSYKAGEKGLNRVRVYEDAKSGRILIEWYERGDEGTGAVRRCARALGHSDRARAKRQAHEVAAALSAGAWSVHAVTLAELFDNYLREMTPSKSRGKRQHDRASAEMFLRAFGSDREARTLNVRDWNRFIQERRAGRLQPAGRKRPTPVRDRQVAYDLRFLLAVLNWATLANDPRGRPLLERNPLRGLPLPREESPRRPLMSRERYEAMRAASAGVDWRFALALVLAFETGHRIGAIRQLLWADVDLADRWITWRADADKIGFEHRTPLSAGARCALREARVKAAAFGGWVLPSPADPSRPCSRNIMRDWWNRAEELAGLPPIRGLGWHSLRRLFATEMKGLPLKDLTHLGGWKSAQTILACYQQPDERTMRSALERREALA